MNKQEFILRQIAKTNKKNYENYVVTRIWHLLDRTDVKFKTQQYVVHENGYALTDMYFPQLQIHIEVDEPFHNKQFGKDLDRETQIVKATNHRIHRIKIGSNLKIINDQIDDVVNIIKKSIENKERENEFIPWIYEQEFKPEYHIEKGYLDADENPCFKTIVDACNTLGQGYKGAQGGWFKSKHFLNHYIWFPKLYEDDSWDNWMDDSQKTIHVICKKANQIDSWFDETMRTQGKRICFPRSKDNLGFTFYRFAGIFETDYTNSSKEKGVIHRLVNKKIELASYR